MSPKSPVPVAVIKPNELVALGRALKEVGSGILDTGFARLEGRDYVINLIGGDGNVDAVLAVRDLLVAPRIACSPLLVGCCGAVPGVDCSKPVVVGDVTYCELGQVRPRWSTKLPVIGSALGAPKVVLKPEHFLRHRYSSGVSARAIANRLGLELAECYCSEKVIKVGPSKGGGRWPWHDQLLGGWDHGSNSVKPFRIVDMESFGALRSAGVARWRLIIVRVPSDSLHDKLRQTDEHQTQVICERLVPILPRLLEWCWEPALSEEEAEQAGSQIWTDFLDTAERMPLSGVMLTDLARLMIQEYDFLAEVTGRRAGAFDVFQEALPSHTPSPDELAERFVAKGYPGVQAAVAGGTIRRAIDNVKAENS